MFIKTVKEIADIVQGKVSGDYNLQISNLSGIKEAEIGDLSFIAQSKYLSFLESSKASAIIIDDVIDCKTSKTLIRVKNASQAFNNLISILCSNDEVFNKRISEKTYIEEDVTIGENCTIQPFAVIEKGARIGNNTIIQSGVFVAKEVEIGCNCRIYPNVTILRKVKIGNNVVIHGGTVIGSDGFGFEPGPNMPEKILQVGSVVIEDDVEIGANVTIDRARLDKTIIKKGTKIDNLVHIAHNVIVGENCLLLAQAGIAGSSILGKNVILAGQSGVTGHLSIGDNVIVTSRGVVTKDIDKGRMVSGFPASDHNKFKRVTVSLNRVPELIKKVNELGEELKKIKKIIGNCSEKPKNNS